MIYKIYLERGLSINRELISIGCRTTSKITESAI